MHMVRGPLSRKSCSVSPSTVLALVLAIRTASNCWLLALSAAEVQGLLHIVGKVHGCFVLAKGE